MIIEQLMTTGRLVRVIATRAPYLGYRKRLVKIEAELDITVYSVRGLFIFALLRAVMASKGNYQQAFWVIKWSLSTLKYLGVENIFTFWYDFQK